MEVITAMVLLSSHTIVLTTFPPFICKSDKVFGETLALTFIVPDILSPSSSCFISRLPHNNDLHEGEVTLDLFHSLFDRPDPRSVMEIDTIRSRSLIASSLEENEQSSIITSSIRSVAHSPI